MRDKLIKIQEFLLKVKDLNEKAFIYHNQGEGSVWIESLNQKCIVITCNSDNVKCRELEDLIVEYCKAVDVNFDLILED